MVTPLGQAIQFFKDFGLFDIILPFLLIFTIVYAILEKTRLLGTTEGKGKEKIANKNLDAMVAFVVGLLVVATANVVRTINEALPQIILLLVIIFSFLLLIGIFWGSEEFKFSEKHQSTYTTLLVLLLIGVILIFLNAIHTDKGTLLGRAWDYVLNEWGGAVFSSIVILIIVVLAIWFITRSKGESK